MIYYLIGFREKDGDVSADLWSVVVPLPALPVMAQRLGERAGCRFVFFADRPMAPETVTDAVQAGFDVLWSLPGVIGLLDLATGECVARVDPLPGPLPTDEKPTDEIPSTEWN